jgi:two-component system, NarL family, sensor histidine kinase UhpB
MPTRSEFPLKILLIDDREEDFVLTRELLAEGAGERYVLDWVSSYEAAVEAIARNEHAACLLDYRLGERDGLDLLRHAIGIGCRAPIIVLTGFGAYDVDVTAMELGAADFLVKGRIDAGTLERAIRYAIERKRAEEALRGAEQRVRSLFENSPDAVFVVDLQSVVLDTNSAALRLHGLERHELLGKNVLELVPPESRTDAGQDFSRLASGETQRLEGLSWNKAGQMVPTEMRASRIDYGGRPAVLLHVRDISEHKRAEDRLRASREQLRALAQRLQSARENERQRIAREVHDGLGQELTSLKIDMAWLGKKLAEAGPPAAAFVEKIESMSGQIDSTIQLVRRITTELRPGVLDALGLVPAIEWQAQEFQKRTGIRCEIAATPATLAPDPDRSTAVFRIFQEILTNVARHAAATHVDIRIAQTGDALTLRVNDNGRGITPEEAASPGALGLLGMRERALVFGGQVAVRGLAGDGTTVTVSVPLQNEPVS